MLKFLRARPLFAHQAILDIGADRSWPVARVRGVDREFGLALGDVEIEPRHAERLGVRIERRGMRSRAEREDEVGVRAVDDHARGALAMAGLQEVALARGRLSGASSTEKIEPMVTLTSMLDEPSSGSSATRKLPCGVEFRRRVALLGSQAAHAGAAQGLLESLVGKEVERLLRVAVGIGADGGGERAGASGPRRIRCGDRDRGVRQRRSRPAQVPARAAFEEGRRGPGQARRLPSSLPPPQRRRPRRCTVPRYAL